MQYRRFGKLDWQVSALGFGTSRLPTIGSDHTRIDETEATRMLHYAIDHGVNYIDSGYHYHGGNAERFLGRALRGGYRQKVKLATKLMPEVVHTARDFDRVLNEQLERLQTDHIDIYMLHGLHSYPRSWPKMRDLGVLDWAQRPLADGRIGYLGFSFHDTSEVLREIVDAYDDWAMCQIQYNYMDIETQAGTQGLQYAASCGLGVAIMEPLLGGRLADPPPAVQEIWATAPEQWTPVEWALQWLWDQPEVSVVLSGMSTMEQVEQNVASADASRLRSLAFQDLALFDQVRDVYESFSVIPCTGCRYCMPCPNGVDIPTNFLAYNRGLMYENLGRSRFLYNAWMPAEYRASGCVRCRECEEKCSQNILISEWMPQVHAVLGEGQPYP